MKILVLGAGYVGWPLAVALSKVHESVSVFDRSLGRVAQLEEEIRKSNLTVHLLSEVESQHQFDVFIIAVPTPVDTNLVPDLTCIEDACVCVGSVIRPGNLVVLESTVAPGTTEKMVAPLIAHASGLLCADFKIGYSSERINPGDNEHGLADVVKVIAASSEADLDLIETVYSPIIRAGLHRVDGIREAELSKLIENTQRDINVVSRVRETYG